MAQPFSTILVISAGPGSGAAPCSQCRRASPPGTCTSWCGTRRPHARRSGLTLFGAQVVNSGSLELLKLPGIFLILGQAERRRGLGGIHARPFRVSSEGPCGHECEAQGRRHSAHAR